MIQITGYLIIERMKIFDYKYKSIIETLQVIESEFLNQQNK